jgi:hypothetical protein
MLKIIKCASIILKLMEVVVKCSFVSKLRVVVAINLVSTILELMATTSTKST